MIQLIPTRGLIDEYAYLYIDDATGHGFVIDPGAQPEKFLSLIQAKGWTIEKILLTHGHFDHIGAVQVLRKELNVPVCAYETADDYLLNPDWNLSAEFGQAMLVPDTVKLSDGDEVRLEADPAVTFRVIHTPGHTTDSVIYYNEKEGIAFTGDTILKRSIGNYTFPGGSYRTLIESITTRILTLPPATMLYSGHSGPTTVGEEIPGFCSFE